MLPLMLSRLLRCNDGSYSVDVDGDRIGGIDMAGEAFEDPDDD